jgi:glycosyltransferase involved in cell wall biosynthesis
MMPSSARSRVPFVSVVVPVRNGAAYIGDCIASLLRTDYPAERRELLIVDNASRDGTARSIKRFPVQYLWEGRRGPAAARNRGVTASRGEIVAFTDADCVVTTGWLRDLVRGFDDDAVAGVAGAIMSYPPETPAQRYMARRKHCWQAPAVHSRSLPYAATANAAFRRTTFDQIGLFDPRFTRAQDKDFGRRFFDAGLQLRYRPSAVVLHRHRATVAGLFTQYAGWGYGAVLLHRKYRLPWGVRSELRRYAALMVAVGKLARACLYRPARSGDLASAAFDVLCRVAYRAGALRGFLSRAPSPEPGWRADEWRRTSVVDGVG